MSLDLYIDRCPCSSGCYADSPVGIGSGSCDSCDAEKVKEPFCQFIFDIMVLRHNYNYSL